MKNAATPLVGTKYGFGADVGAGAAVSARDSGRAGGTVLRDALLDSRQHWRDLVMLSADLVFETDDWGRFVLIAPDPALGWQAGLLIGQPAELLLADSDSEFGFNPFRPTAPVRRRRAWLRRPDGGTRCMAFATAPLLDVEGRIIGARGMAQDVTEQDGHDAAVAAALRRGELLDHILWRMRQEVLTPRMMQAAVGALVTALAAEGCAVMDALGDGMAPAVLHQIGGGLAAVLPTAMTLLDANAPGSTHAESAQTDSTQAGGRKAGAGEPEPDAVRRAGGVRDLARAGRAGLG